MGWLDRLFGHHEKQTAPTATPVAATPATTATATPQQQIPPERVGLRGEYDQSGLAKRVAKAFDEAGLQDHETVWIAQTGTVVVLKGKVHNREILSRMVSVAKLVNGATAVETDQVTIAG